MRWKYSVKWNVNHFMPNKLFSYSWKTRQTGQVFKMKSTWLTICYSMTKTKFLYRVPNKNSRFGIGCGLKTFFDFNTQGRCEVFKVKVMIMIYWLSLTLYAIFSEPQNFGGTKGDLPLVLIFQSGYSLVKFLPADLIS